MKKLGFIIAFSTLFAFGLSAQTVTKPKTQAAPKATAQTADNSRSGSNTTTTPAKKTSKKKTTKVKSVSTTATPAPARVKKTQAAPAASSPR